MKLIDKDKIVAEIEKCYNECLKRAKVIDSVDYDYWNAKAEAYRNVLVILDDTIEVKEVDLEEEINEWQGCEVFPEGVDITPLPKAMEIVERTAKHFFELGLRTQKGE